MRHMFIFFWLTNESQCMCASECIVFRFVQYKFFMPVSFTLLKKNVSLAFLPLIFQRKKICFYTSMCNELRLFLLLFNFVSFFPLLSTLFLFIPVMFVVRWACVFVNACRALFFRNLN